MLLEFMFKSLVPLLKTSFKVTLLLPLYTGLFLLATAIFIYTYGYKGATFLWWTPFLSIPVLGVMSLYLLFSSRRSWKRLLFFSALIICASLVPLLLTRLYYAQFENQLCSLSIKEQVASCECDGIKFSKNLLMFSYCRGVRSQCKVNRNIINAAQDKFHPFNPEIGYTNEIDCSEMENIREIQFYKDFVQ